MKASLSVESCVRHGPVEILAGQGFPAELPVVGHPSGTFVFALGPDNCGLICPEFRGLEWESGGQDGRHQGESLHPLGYVSDSRGGRPGICGLSAMQVTSQIPG